MSTTANPERVNIVHLIGRILRDEECGSARYNEATALMRMFRIGPDEINAHAGCED